MGLPLRDAQRHTYGEYLRWPEDVRCELIDGEAYLMAPAPTAGHRRLVLGIARQLADALEGHRCEVFVAPFDVRLPRADEADEAIDTVVQPDLTIVCDPAKIDERGCHGAPDWVIEVLSPASAAHDQTVKLAAYERAGVRECWLVHPADRTATVYSIAQGRYGRPAISELTGVLASRVLPEVAIDWERALREPAAGRAGEAQR
ncbi:MAG: Uma2 family endonuclease [Rhodocyclaceae bacterium]